MSLKKKKITKGTAKNSKILAVVICLVAIAVFATSLIGLKTFFKTENYYVLNTDVQARTLITPEMLEVVTTSEGTAPISIPIGDIQAGNLYSKIPLVAGTVPSYSTVGPLDDISVGVPDNWVVTSFGVSADSAVGGRIVRGVYFDLMVVGDEGSYYPFVNVLALDTTISLNNASSSDAVDTSEARAGQTEEYYVAMTPENAAKLHNILKNESNIKLVLSPRQNEYSAPRLSDYEGVFTYDPNVDSVTNQGSETDYSFTRVNRDACGVPEGHVLFNESIEKEDCGTEGNNSVTRVIQEPAPQGIVSNDNE